MSIEFTIRKGSTNPTSGSGITLGEPAFNYSNNTLWIGKGYGVTAAWVGAGICGASGGIAAGLTYQIPTLGAVKDYFTAVSSNFLGTTAAYVTSFNGSTGAVQGVSAAVAGTGISVSGATGSVTITNTGVQSFNGITGAVTGVASVNGSTGAVVTYVGTTGNIPYRYGTGVGITANSYFTLQSGDIGDPTDILLLSGVTGTEYWRGNTEAIGLRIARNPGGIGLDEGAHVSIDALGLYQDGVDQFGSGLRLTTPNISSSGSIRLAPAGTDVVTVSAGGIDVTQPLTASAGILTDSIAPLVGLGNLGSLYINSNDGGGGGETITYIGDWYGDANGTYLIVDDLNGGLALAGSNIYLYGVVTTSTDVYANSVRVGRGEFTGTTNTVLGTGAGAAGTTGANNTFVGYRAGDVVTTGSRNIAVGRDALGAGVTANDNIAIGHNALLLVSSGVADGTVAIGSYALDALTTGAANTAIGYNALGKTNTGSRNIAIGYLAMENATTVSDNVAIGRYALNSKTSSGDNNLAIGTNAMVYASSARNNTAVGNSVMAGAVATGEYNSGIGYSALYLLTSGSYNCAVGPSSLYSLTTGAANTGVGMEALLGMKTGSNNTGIGASALYGVSSGGGNIAIGTDAGRYYGVAGITATTTLNNSTYIGYATKPSADSVTNEMALGYQALGLGSNTTVIGNSNTTATTIYGLLNAPSGISAAGATFSGSVRLQNAEYIQNTTNGRVDIMPGPAAATAYGMYFDLTSWTYGVAMGTIKSSDGTLNNGSLRFDASPVIANDVSLAFGSSGTSVIRHSTTGLDTMQLGVIVGNASYSGAVAIYDYSQGSAANRSPGISHSNPNLYVYRAGAASANDFIRTEHDGTNGNIVSGGITGISIQPGSGVLGISGDTVRVSTQKTPASATAAGTKGDIVHDTLYIYVCTATNTWKRAALSTW